jgi:hypothetical protein
MERNPGNNCDPRFELIEKVYWTPPSEPRPSLRNRIARRILIGSAAFAVAVAFIAGSSWLGVTLNTINKP